VPVGSAAGAETTTGDGQLEPSEPAGPEGHPSLREAARALVTGYVLTVGLLTGFGFLLPRVLLDGPVGRADDSIVSWLSEHRTATLGRVTDLVSRSVDTIGAIAIALVVCAVLAFLHRWREVAVVVVGLAFELSCFLTIGFFVDRPRPKVPQIGALPATSSYPSGHTAATVVIYASVAVAVWAVTGNRFWRALAWLVAVAMPLFVAFARVYRGMHHPLDVVAGLVLGGLALLTVLRAIRADRQAAAGDGPPVGERAPAAERAPVTAGRD
jgi:undecaprenyl-diphosphatase